MAISQTSWTKESRALIKPTPRGPSRLNQTVRDTFLQVFNEIQDSVRYPKANLLAVAQDNPALFYTLAAKLIPTEVQGSLRSVINVSITDPMEDIQDGVIESSIIIEPLEDEGSELPG